MGLRHLILVALLLIPSASAISFFEDFEGFTLTGFSPETTPAQDWYEYRQANSVGEVSQDPPTPTGTQSMRFRADSGSTGSNRGDFVLAAPTQLTNITFEIQGVTVDDNGVGSRQVVKIQSSSPTRTMVEFHLFCGGVNNTSACDFRVRWEHVETNGQLLINSTLGDSLFNVTVLPDWINGEFQLYVNGVNDGTFPFLELPQDVGRLRFQQSSGAYPLNASFDSWFIDGALEGEAVTGDIATGLQNFATNIRFTSGASLFLLGLVFFVTLVLSVAVPIVSLGKDNTLLPGLVFFVILALLWMVYLEWWPDWIGISAIILVSALIALTIRQLLMGIRDASTNAGIVAGALGYFIIATSLLGFSGYATEEIQVPTSSLETPDDEAANATTGQTFTGAVVECLVTFFSDCTRDTVSQTWATITDVASTVFNFARTAFTFLFQLLTFQLPIPVVFNVMIVLPPAAALATVGLSFITRSGS